MLALIFDQTSLFDRSKKALLCVFLQPRVIVFGDCKTLKETLGYIEPMSGDGVDNACGYLAGAARMSVVQHQHFLSMCH